MSFPGTSRGRGAGSLERHVITLPARKGATTYNNYLLVSAPTREAVLIDAAGDPTTTLDLIQRQRARVRHILLTHGHPGHWRALGRLREALGVPVGIHLADADMLPLTPNFALAGNQSIAFGVARILVLHTPGHTPGSVCFLIDGMLYSGDMLLAGQSRFPTAPAEAAVMAQSLDSQVLPLRDNTLIYPGHGDATTVGAERRWLTAWVDGQRH